MRISKISKILFSTPDCNSIFLHKLNHQYPDCRYLHGLTLLQSLPLCFQFLTRSFPYFYHVLCYMTPRLPLHFSFSLKWLISTVSLWTMIEPLNFNSDIIPADKFSRAPGLDQGLFISVPIVPVISFLLAFTITYLQYINIRTMSYSLFCHQ